MAMSQAKPTCSAANKPASRKRREASLTAEALWNIQMEDDTSVKHDQPFKKSDLIEANNKIDANHPAIVKNSEKKISDIVHRRKKRTSKTNLIIDESKTCLHLPQQALSKKDSRKCQAKEKPTASVVPLVVSEKKYSPSPEERQSSDAGDSQVLLLPISLNPGGRAAVPILALHPSTVSVDLMNCLNAPSLMSPIVNMTTMLTGSTTYLPRNTIDRRLLSLRYCASRNLNNPINRSENAAVDQTEPLNLKLGESSIPSGTMHKTEWTRKSVAETDVTAPDALWQRMSVLISHTKHGISFAGRKFPDSFETKYSSGRNQCKEPTWYDAYSPSSESSFSVDAYESVGPKTNINLRCKAAPPPGRMGRLIESERRRPLSGRSDNNGWIGEGRPYNAFVYSVETGRPVIRLCYPSMRRKGDSANSPSNCPDDDIVLVRDCVILRADAGEHPYVAKVAALWQQPGTEKIMISLLWFYRSEHTADAKVLNSRYNEDELFASRHLDEISVACVEDKCYVLTYNHYCRYTAALEKAEEHFGAIDGRDSIPQTRRLHGRPTTKSHHNLSAHTDKSLVYFCRKFYDVKSHRLLKTFPPPTPLFYANTPNM